ncbi:MAG: hypothetical protein IT209_03175 [Armatimonadetes bacterium]|nr:hypothetical protein [Armatimonadota bacterium]
MISAQSAGAQLAEVCAHLAHWRKGAANPEGRCLEAVRWALAQEALSLPGPFVRPNNTALGCFDALEKAPERWSWQRWTHAQHPGQSLPLCLVFFKDCGYLSDGRVAGHVAVYDPARRRHEANQVYPMTLWWAQRLIGAFVPLRRPGIGGAGG